MQIYRELMRQTVIIFIRDKLLTQIFNAKLFPAKEMILIHFGKTCFLAFIYTEIHFAHGERC